MSDQEILNWQKDPSSKNMAIIVKKYTPLLMSELPKYKGNLPSSTMKSIGKKLIIKAARTYNPERGKFSTHLVPNLLPLHRTNYESSSTVRLSEELQSGVNVYKQMVDYLKDKFGHEPTIAELADNLNWTPSKVARTQKMLKQEVIASNIDVTPAYTKEEDPRLAFVYKDLDAQDKFIFEKKLGYLGTPTMSSGDIAKKLGISQTSVSLKSKKIADFIKKTFKMR